MATKEILQPKGLWDPRSRSFSQGVKVKGGSTIIYVAGQASFDDNFNVIGKGDIEFQTRRTLESVQAVLDQAGAKMSDVVRITVYLTDIRHMAAMQKVRKEFFPVDPPASTGIQVSALAEPDLLVEIDAIAIL